MLYHSEVCCSSLGEHGLSVCLLVRGADTNHRVISTGSGTDPPIQSVRCKESACSGALQAECG